MIKGESGSERPIDSTKGCGSVSLELYFSSECACTRVCDLEAGSPSQQEWALPLRTPGSSIHPWLPRVPGWEEVLMACVCSFPGDHSLYLLRCGLCPLPGPSYHLLSLHHGEKGPGPQACPHRPPWGPNGECHLRVLRDWARGGCSCHSRGGTGWEMERIYAI